VVFPGHDHCSTRRFRAGAIALLIGLALVLTPKGSSAQQQADNNPAPLSSAPPATLHGVVKNTATGQPLPRALVSVGGDSGLAALTDGDGRFEIGGVSQGPNVVTLTKPGFDDGTDDSSIMGSILGTGSFTHNVVVVAGMPDVDFAMRPSNAIHGQIQLSTGDPGENIKVTLFERAIQDGRAMWRPRDTRPTGADGAYRFAGLPDGVYAVTAVDSELDVAQMLTTSRSEVDWFAAMYYPDARDFSSAGRIRLAGGQQVQANFMLVREPFHLVRAAVASPNGAAVGNSASLPKGTMIFLTKNGANVPLEIQSVLSGLEAKVTDLDGRLLPYRPQYDAGSHTVRALLPDGTYSLRLSASRPAPAPPGGTAFRHNSLMTGQGDVSVAGHPVTNMRIAVAPAPSDSLQVLVNRTQPQPESLSGTSDSNTGVYISATLAGQGVVDQAQGEFAQGPTQGMLETNPLAPGSYWLHTIVAERGLCESSFTAGGANMAREPFVVAPGGSTAPLTLTLRDDCASLKVSLPGENAGIVAGEEPAYTVYVVPDADLTTDAPVATLRASTGGVHVFNNLTPGSYHVYTFTAAVNLEYHNHDALAALPTPGQQITLSPGDTGSLVVEVPQP